MPRPILRPLPITVAGETGTGHGEPTPTRRRRQREIGPPCRAGREIVGPIQTTLVCGSGVLIRAQKYRRARVRTFMARRPPLRYALMTLDRPHDKEAGDLASGGQGVETPPCVY